MNYELAKELKDAGFPQKCADADMRDMFAPISIVDYPTLEELIEACGYGFRQLTRHTVKREFREWQAKAGKSTSCPNRLFNGATPEIAVAKLWLALNKK